MKLEFDPDWLRTSMSMWRDAVDMKTPIHDDFKVHFLEKRGVLLEGFIHTATSWKMVLRACKADGEDQTALVSLLADIEAFQKWAEEGLTELSSLGIQESLKDKVQQVIQGANPGRSDQRSPKPKDPDRDKRSP